MERKSRNDDDRLFGHIRIAFQDILSLGLWPYAGEYGGWSFASHNAGACADRRRKHPRGATDFCEATQVERVS